MYDTASTLIDNVFSNVIDKDHTRGILVRPISDHEMYFCILNKNYIKSITKRKFVEIEESSQEALARFKTELQILQFMTNYEKTCLQIQTTIIKFYRGSRKSQNYTPS